MLNKFRTHQKKILWGLAIIIIPAFVLWGSLKDNSQESIIKIAGRNLSRQEVKQYLDMAEIYFALYAQANKDKKITYQDRDIKAVEYLLLIWKADKEKIKVSDEEVISAIKNIKLFNPQEQFNEYIYSQFLRQIKRNAHIEPRTFEEYIRNILKAEKLYAKYVKNETNENEQKVLEERMKFISGLAKEARLKYNPQTKSAQ